MKNLFYIIFFSSSLCVAQSTYQCTWATYFGGNSFESRSAEIDTDGNIYVLGNVIPWENNDYYESFSSLGAHQPQINGGREGVIVKFSSSGELLWCTYFGSEGDDVFYDLAINAQNELFICGYAEGNFGIVTLPPDFVMETVPLNRKGFLAKFSSSGQLISGKYVPGIINKIIINSADELYAAGKTSYTSYVATPGSFDQVGSSSSQGSLFISKYSSEGIKLWSTYYGGGTFLEICNDTGGNLYVTGSSYQVPLNYYFTSGAFQSDLGYSTRVFLSKFSAEGQRVWSTYYGSPEADTSTSIFSMCTDNKSLYITGATNASSGISTPGSYQPDKAGLVHDPFGQDQWDADDTHIAKFNLDGERVWSTYFGGEYCDRAVSIDVAENKLFITGITKSFSGISTPEAFQTTLSATPGPGDWTNYHEKFDSFVAEFTADGNRTWATYFGGDKNDGWFTTRSVIKVRNGSLFLFGITHSENNISTPGAFQANYIAPTAPPSSSVSTSDWGYNMFLARFDPLPLAVDSHSFSELVLFPNPNNGIFTLRGYSEFSDLEIKIIDIQGRIVTSKDIIIDGLLTEINVHNQLQSGFYFVRVSSHATIKTFKIFVE